jgi:hypothetical protein
MKLNRHILRRCCENPKELAAYLVSTATPDADGRMCSYSLINGTIAAARDWAPKQIPTLPNPSETPVIRKSRKGMARQLSRSYHPYESDQITAAKMEILIKIVHDMGHCEIAAACALCWGTTKRMGAILRLNFGSFSKERDKLMATAQEGVTLVYPFDTAGNRPMQCPGYHASLLLQEAASR